MGVENIQDVRQAKIIALERQIDGSPARREGGLQILQTLARSAKIGDRVVHLRDRHQNGFLVVHQEFVRFELLGDDEGIQASEIQDRPVAAWSD